MLAIALQQGKEYVAEEIERCNVWAQDIAR